MHGHGHIHPSQRDLLDRGLLYRSCVVEIDKSHHIPQTVVHRQGRVFQDIGHIGLPQDVHVPPHHQFLHRTAQRCVKIHIHLAVNHSPLGTGSIQQLIILGMHFKVHCRPFQIREIHLAVNGKRSLAFGEYIELLEHHLTVHHLHRFIIKTEHGRHLRHEESHGIQCQFPIQQGFGRITFHGQCSINIPVQFHHAVGHKRIGDIQRKMFEGYIRAQASRSFLRGQIDTSQMSYLLTIMAYIGIQMMILCLTGQIHTTQFPISQRTAFIFEFIYTQITAHHHIRTGIYIMRFCSDPSFHIRHIGKDTPEFFQIDA